MDDNNYKVVSYTQKELDYFYGKIRQMEKSKGKRIPIKELIVFAIEDEDKNFVYFLFYMQRMQRSVVIEEKLKDTNFNFREGKDKPQKYTEEEVNEFEETLNNYWKDGFLDLYETIDKAIENKNFKLINYLDYIETKKEDAFARMKTSKTFFLQYKIK